MTEQINPNALFGPPSQGIRLGWFGREGEWAVAEGHLNQDVFAAAVNATFDPPVDPVAAVSVIHRHAVLTEDTTLPEDHDLRVCIRWEGITEDTENAFPVTAINTEA